jgi:hypothetical protein
VQQRERQGRPQEERIQASGEASVLAEEERTGCRAGRLQQAPLSERAVCEVVRRVVGMRRRKGGSKVEVKFCVVDKTGCKCWNTTAAMFLDDQGQRSIFTKFAAAQAVAKEQKGSARYDCTCDVVRITEWGMKSSCVVGAAPSRRVVDITESLPTRAGKIPPIIVDMIDRAMERGNTVEVELVKFEN